MRPTRKSWWTNFQQFPTNLVSFSKIRAAWKEKIKARHWSPGDRSQLATMSHNSTTGDSKPRNPCKYSRTHTCETTQLDHRRLNNTNSQRTCSASYYHALSQSIEKKRKRRCLRSTATPSSTGRSSKRGKSSKSRSCWHPKWIGSTARAKSANSSLRQSRQTNDALIRVKK